MQLLHKKHIGLLQVPLFCCLHQTQISTALELLKKDGAWCILDGENNKDLSVIINTLMLFVSMLGLLLDASAQVLGDSILGLCVEGNFWLLYIHHQGASALGSSASKMPFARMCPFFCPAGDEILVCHARSCLFA